MTVLLRNIGTHVDPTVLIQKIEDGVVITGLRDSLVQIMLDYRLQVSIKTLSVMHVFRMYSAAHLKGPRIRDLFGLEVNICLVPIF